MDMDQPLDQPEVQNDAAHRLSLDFKVGITLMMVVLAVAVVVLALTDSEGGTETETVVTKTVPDPALKRQIAALNARVARGERAAAGLRATVAALNARVGSLATRLDRVRPGAAGTAGLIAQLRTVSAQLQVANQCLFQVQRQLDDIQGYYTTRTPLRKRVSGPCLKILQPRYGGQ